MKGIQIILLMSVLACWPPTAEAYVCILKRRYDPATKRDRWAMPIHDICFCQGVIAPENRGTSSCPVATQDEYSGSNLWYTDNPKPLTLRKNWTPEKLNQLLGRVDFCTRNECDSNPCQNGAMCRDDIGSFVCVCQAGYVGKTCQEEPSSMEGSTGDQVSVTSDQDDTTAVTTDSEEHTSTAGSSTEYDERTTRSEECYVPLGMEDGSIHDGNIQASSLWASTTKAYNARLNGIWSWGAHSSDDEPWIQADIGFQTTVTCVVTQGDGGNGSNDDWVKTLKVSTFLSNTSDPETVIQDAAGMAKEFEANADINTAVTIHLNESVTAQIVRIYPLSSKGSTPFMRFELLGCNATKV